MGAKSQGVFLFPATTLLDRVGPIITVLFPSQASRCFRDLIVRYVIAACRFGNFALWPTASIGAAAHTFAEHRVASRGCSGKGTRLS